MPPQTQPLIYENDKGDRVQWNGSAWAAVPKPGAGKEAAAVASRPNVNDPAAFKQNISAPITGAKDEESTFVPTHGYGGGGSYVSGKHDEIQGIRDKQRMVAETGLAAAGGEVVAPVLEGLEGAGAARFIGRAATRAAGTGTGAGAGTAVSGGDLKDAAKTAGLWGGTELGLAAALAGPEHILKTLMDPKLNMQQAAQMLAGTLSKEELSPAQFGKSVQEGFDAISRKAGQEKGEFLTRVATEHTDLTVTPRNLQQVLETRVKALEEMKSRNPDLFAQGEGLDKTLRILRSELDSTNGELAGIKSGIRKGNLESSDLRRSQFWNYKQQLDPSMASRIVGELDKATTQDITESLVRTDKKLAEEYLQKSARYHELQNLGRTETIQKVFGDARVAPDKVAQVFVQAPEEAMAAIRTLNKENPVAIQNLRRALFEQGVKTTGVNSVFKQQPALLRELYGPQADSVMQFVAAVNKKATSDALVHAIPGAKGAMFRVLTGSGRGVTIRGSEMAKILKSSEMLRLFTQAAETPANSGPGRLMQETLDRAIKALEMEPGEGGAPKPRANPPGWKTAPAAEAAPETPPETPPSMRRRTPGTPGSPGSRTATWQGGGTTPGTKAGPVTREPLWKQPLERRGAGETRRQTPGSSPTGAERRSTGAAQRQISALESRLKGASEEEKKIINDQIKSLKENPGDAEYEDRRGKREAGAGSPKADPAKMREAIEKQRKRLQEFEQEYQRILREQGGE